MFLFPREEFTVQVRERSQGSPSQTWPYVPRPGRTHQTGSSALWWPMLSSASQSISVPSLLLKVSSPGLLNGSLPPDVSRRCGERSEWALQLPEPRTSVSITPQSLVPERLLTQAGERHLACSDKNLWNSLSSYLSLLFLTLWSIHSECLSPDDYCYSAIITGWLLHRHIVRLCYLPSKGEQFLLYIASIHFKIVSQNCFSWNSWLF